MGRGEGREERERRGEERRGEERREKREIQEN